MRFSKTLLAAVVVASSSSALAYEFSFDRPGIGFGTGITPVGKLAWEQGLPTFSYAEHKGNSQLTLNADTVLRTGLMKGLELQVGWNGHTWTKTKENGVESEVDGSGDMSVAIKKAFDLKDDKLAWAVMAQANLATGSDAFTADKDTYTLGSTLEYAYDENVSTDITMNYSIDEDGKQSTIQVLPYIGYKITDKLSGYGEFAYTKTEGEKAAKSLGTGLVYSISDRAQFDVSVDVGLNGEEQRHYTGGLGVSYLF